MQRLRCQSCGRTHSRPPEGVTRQQGTRSWQDTLIRLYVLGISLCATCARLELLGCFVSPVSLWRDVQRLQAEAPWNTTAKLPGVVLLDETWLPLEGRQQPVAVVLDTEIPAPCGAGRGAGFRTAYFQELEARGVHTLVTDDDPAFRKALQGCGLDRQLCVVHMRRTVRRRLQRMRKGKDRILPAPEDAAVLQGVVRLVWELPLWGGRLLLVCCEWAHQGAVRLSPPVLALVEHVMDRWNDLVRDPSVPPARTGWRAGLDASSPGRGWPAAEDAAGDTGLPAPAGRPPGLKPAGPPGPSQRSRSCPPEPFSTKVKQCGRILFQSS